MHFNVWLLFAGASLIMGLIPGPGVTTIVGQALSRGRASALAAVAGAACGNAASMTLSLAGAGAILAASAQAFTLLKWIGAAYLIGLGLLTIFKTLERGAADVAPISGSRSFWGTFAVTLLNPKTIIFFTAFVPQFITHGAPFWPQAALLIATFTAIVFATDAIYAIVASSASQALRHPGFVLWTKRAGGGALIGAGLITATLRAK